MANVKKIFFQTSKKPLEGTIFMKTLKIALLGVLPFFALDVSAQIVGNKSLIYLPIETSNAHQFDFEKRGAEAIAKLAEEYGYEVVRENGLPKGYWLDHDMPIVNGRPNGTSFTMYPHSYSTAIGDNYYSNYTYANQNLGRASFDHGCLTEGHFTDVATLGERLDQLGPNAKNARIFVDPEMYVPHMRTNQLWETITPAMTADSKYWQRIRETHPEMAEIINQYAPIGKPDFRPALMFVDTTSADRPMRNLGPKLPCTIMGPYESAAAFGSAIPCYNSNFAVNKSLGYSDSQSSVIAVGRTLNQAVWGAATGAWATSRDTGIDILDNMMGRRPVPAAEVPNSLFRGWSEYLQSLQRPNYGQPFLNLGPGA